MAMMDNVDFLISHIRNAFVTSDDTSMSEWIITECRMQEDNDHKGDHRYSRNNHISRSDSNSDCQSDSELKGSVDIHPDMDFGAHRRRSNTAQRLERLKKEKRTQSKMKTIVWKENSDSYKADEKGHLFEKKDLPSTEDPNLSSAAGDGSEIVSEVIVEDRQIKRQPRSTFSQQLSEMQAHGSNPFFKYAKFDGRTAGGMPTRKLDIYLTFASPEQRPYPMSILVTANAKAQEVMGLVCWQYTQEGRKPDITTVVGHVDPNSDLSKFSLHMAEDDGEIDTDFPPIVPTDPVSKYGFTKFALVANAPVQPKSSIVTINVPNNGYNTFQVESMTVTMRELMEKVIKRRKIKIRHGLNYTLEKAAEAGKPIDLDAMLVSMNCLEFYLIRENSSRGDVESIGEEHQRIADRLLCHQYKSYIVSMVNKLRTNTEVQLGISGEKIEIDPVSVKDTFRLIRQKAMTFDADNVAAIEITETKANGRSKFRLTYLNGHDYKNHYFEAEQSVAQEIVEKVENILALSFSQVKKEFVDSQLKKALRKRDSIIKLSH